jgi:hypothetical protein
MFLTGSIDITHADGSRELASAGEPYHWAAGHTGVSEGRRDLHGDRPDRTDASFQRAREESLRVATELQPLGWRAAADCFHVGYVPGGTRRPAQVATNLTSG